MFRFRLATLVLVVGGVTVPVQGRGNATRGFADANRDIASGNVTFYMRGNLVRRSGDVPLPNWLAKRVRLTYAPGWSFNSVPADADIEYKNAYSTRVLEWLDAEFGRGILDYQGELERLGSEVTRLSGPCTESAARLARADVVAGRFLRIRTEPATAIDDAFEERLWRDLGVLTVELDMPLKDLRCIALTYDMAMKDAMTARFGAGRLARVEADAATLIAERDIADGRVIMVRVGEPPQEWEVRYQRILQERFGVQMREYGCIVPAGFDFDRYNARMQREIEARFGPGALEAAEREAKAPPPGVGVGPR